MKAGSSIVIILFFSLVLFGIVADGARTTSKLRYNYYKYTCRQAEGIVKKIIQEKATNNSALAAKLIRMQFHDCFVRGCDASVLLDTVNNSSRAEKEAIPNQSLSGFDVIDEIKTAIEKVCPRVVSCADILALAARDSVSLTFKWPLWEVQLGRRDGRISLANETNGNIPSPFANFTTLVQIFKNKGLDVNDLVVLSGAHTIGVSHCGGFSRRLYNFTGRGDADPSLDPIYANSLRKECPNPASPTKTVEMDPGSAHKFDTNYYNILLQNKGLFTSDAALITNRNSRRIVTQLQKQRKFFSSFESSMIKMGAIGVLTGKAGEIRKNCRVVN